MDFNHHSDHSDHLAANRSNWDERATLHAARDGSGYLVQRYVQDRTAISDVVAFDRPLLGDVRGLKAVHLQCHIGTDTLSLSRLGADVVGLDFSANAVEEARRLVAESGDDVAFVQSDVYEATSCLAPGTFDLVYTGIGALCWLPRVTEWAETVAALLAPGGFLFIREGHPLLWAMDESMEDGLHLRFPYFEHEAPTEWDDDHSYVPTAHSIQASKTYEWNHSIGEIVTALIAAGLRIDFLVEHRSVPWEALPNQMSERADGEWVLNERPESAPLTYTLRATKAPGASTGA